MEPIGLGEMDSIKLMNRVDTKFVTTESVLARILEMADDRYRVLTMDGRSDSPYDTLYYDTPDLEMYTEHRNGHLVRQKVRTRTYLNSGETFLEIKRKNNHGRTRKKRMGIPRASFSTFGDIPEAAAFLAGKSRYTSDRICPALGTTFTRITLVNNGKTERLTIDRDLRFHNVRTGLDASLPGAVIIELKQDGLAASPMKEILRQLRVFPLRVSKYCIGTVLTDPAVRKGRFKEKVRAIEKIIDKKLQ